MVPFHNYLYAFFDLCQYGIRVAGEFGLTNM